jgi:hypothetical protein
LPNRSLGKQALELRVIEAVTGRLRLRSGHRTLLEKPISALPERRILVPLASLPTAGVAGTIVAEIVA